MKRAAVMMDLSAVGRCALAVAMPVLSMMGVQACPLPTMLLSTHTGGFGAPETMDATVWLSAAMAHYLKLDLQFDAVYIGYLASGAQVDLAERLLDSQRGYVLIDPVMADHGKLYSGIEKSRPEALRRLVARADLVTPNLTEAQLLVGEEMDAPSLLERLLGMGSRAALITGVDGCNWYQALGERPLCVPFQRVPQDYPGTGDLFDAVLLGALLQGMEAASAIQHAAAFVERAARLTLSQHADPREGVRFEALLSSVPRP